MCLYFVFSIWVFCAHVRDITKWRSLTVHVTHGGKAMWSQPSAWSISNCTPAQRTALLRWASDTYIIFRPWMIHLPLIYIYIYISKAYHRILWEDVLPIVILYLWLTESGDHLRMVRDAEMGHGWRGNGLLLWIYARWKETSLGQNIHSLCKSPKNEN